MNKKPIYEGPRMIIIRVRSEQVLAASGDFSTQTLVGDNTDAGNDWGEN